MGVYWEPVDVGFAVLGGALIAASSSLSILIMGRITGLSGVFFSIIRAQKNEGLLWKYCFMVGLTLSPFMFYYCESRHLEVNGYSYRILDSQYEATEGLDLGGWVIGGLCVGFGTRLGNGCTSGHGVNGLPRFAIRSFVAVGCFLSTAVGVATLKFYEPFLSNTQTSSPELVEVYDGFAIGFMGIFVIIFLVINVIWIVKYETVFDRFEPVISFLLGALFGFGLLLAGMCRRTKIIAFLSLGDGWDPSLMFVLASACSINVVTFHFLYKDPRVPLLREKIEMPANTKVDWMVIVGPIIFGIGWGLSGFCPGPGMVNMFFVTHAGLLMVCVAIGQICAYQIIKWDKKKKQALKASESNSGGVHLVDK